MADFSLSLSTLWDSFPGHTSIVITRNRSCLSESTTAFALIILCAIARVSAGMAGAVLCTIDLRRKLLPNALLFPALLSAPALLFLAAAVHGRWGNLRLTVVGSAVMFAPDLTLTIIFPPRVGHGGPRVLGSTRFLLGLAASGGVGVGHASWACCWCCDQWGSMIAGLAGQSGSAAFLPLPVCGCCGGHDD